MIAPRLVACLAVLISGGCSVVPENIAAPVSGPSVAEARTNPGVHTGARVRWGGTISEVDNLPGRTRITVVARPLRNNGEPLGERPATGRFIADVDGFLDPADYQPETRITIVGRFTGIQAARIDEYVYDYPLVQVQDLHRWREYVQPDPWYDYPYYRPLPFWHDPWWGHYHGYRHYPWY